MCIQGCVSILWQIDWLTVSGYGMRSVENNIDILLLGLSIMSETCFNQDHLTKMWRTGHHVYVYSHTYDKGKSSMDSWLKVYTFKFISLLWSKILYEAKFWDNLVGLVNWADPCNLVLVHPNYYFIKLIWQTCSIFLYTYSADMNKALAFTRVCGIITQ